MPPRPAPPDGTRRPKTKTPNGNAAQPACCKDRLPRVEPAAKLVGRRRRPEGVLGTPKAEDNAQREFAAGSATLRVPAACSQVSEDEHAAPVLENELEVAAPDGPIAPPAILDEPVLQHRVDTRA